ncbi:MAG: T9SS type A sorting domain-containing protein [Bacteroidota bacterium]
MRQKLLLLLMMVSFGALYAQTDTIRTLVITELRYDRADHAYIEITNMGVDAVNLAEFELLMLTPWNPFPDGALWPTEPHRVDNQWMMLPDQSLAPGESYVLATFHDYAEEQYVKDVSKFGFSYDWSPHVTKPEFYELADIQLHRAEAPFPDPSDSVSTGQQAVLEVWQGRETLFLRHHPPGGDSAVVDQVGGDFSDPDGTNEDSGYRDVAGMSQATDNATLVRRFIVKQGNLTWIPGNDLAESEWIPIPHVNQWGDGYESTRAVFWTVGNHGDYNLDETTLTSSTVDINWTDQILTVPWGVRNDDSIMYQFDRVPGLAWHYHYNSGDGAHEDSSYVSVRTGDSLTIYACGNDLDVIKWHIEAAAPTADANIVIPKRGKSEDGDFIYSGAPFDVTDGVVMDTVRDIPFATRVDTLFKYLEKAPNASWEIVWLDGNERTDLLDGDILKVTAEDNSVKEYYLKLQKYIESRNAYISAITWPDIPEDYKDFFGWVGDTIPNFLRTKYDYKVQVPWDVDGVPALIAKTEDQNATVEVQRAANLFGTVADRTATFISTAENDTSILTYSVLMEKEKAGTDIQPWNGVPFISQFIFWEEYSNGMVEIVNPGNQPLDLSDYMFFNGYENDPSAAIAGWDAWDARYVKYIPGYKWTNLESEWDVQRHIAVQDLNINPIVQPGDVFVMADIRNSWANHWYRDQIDIDFNMDTVNGFIDIWGESYQGESAARQWKGANFYMWKILNDSIKLGLKPASDPNDFELIDVFGSGDGSDYMPHGYSADMISSFTRRPGIYSGNPVHQGSFGADVESGEWELVDQALLQSLGYPWPDWRYAVPDGLGSHFMDDVTIYRSTVSSLVYKVSSGYTMDEEIRGVLTATTVEDLFSNILKADPDQGLTVMSSGDGSVVDSALAVVNGDTLVVISADSTNVSKYILEVTDDGLSDDALLVSTEYEITVDGASGTVGGMDYGTTLKAVVNNVTVPAGASFTIMDANGAYQSLVTLNFDTVYVDVLVSDQIYFEVIAEDGVTTITYQLTPNADETSAFVTSDVFMVDQAQLLISLIPEGTNVDAFLGKLVPAPGATWVLLDKYGFERTEGEVVQDDKLIVTAADGVTTKAYYLSILNQEANYLAYVVSEIYLVDQDALTITGVRASNSVADFSGNVTPSAEASMEVQDATGAAKADGDMMAEDDMLQVTAGNGVTVVTYTIELDYTGINDLVNADIRIYPNPSSGLLNIAGAEIGSRIRVYNSVGRALHNVVVYSGIEVISLDDQPGGMYFITISNDEDVLGHYKVIKQ